jgi:hypothetical protein
MPSVARSADPRSDARSNVFLTAVLIAEQLPRPVRVRNISANGALIDGANLPPRGGVIRLVRGSLSVNGEVAWREHDQCGIQFDDEVSVEDWVRKVEHPGQQRVDQMLSIIRCPGRGSTAPSLLTAEVDSVRSISADLRQVSARLADLPDLLVARSTELQELDAIVQRLDNFTGVA